MQTTIRNLPIVLLLFILLLAEVAAQNTAGCSGGRYIEPVFLNTFRTEVTYGENVNNGEIEELKMYVLEPEGDSLEKRPVVILAAGTAFRGGSDVRFGMLDLCLKYARRGYVAATIHYRQLPNGTALNNNTLPDAIVDAMHDMKAAVRYFKQDRKTTNTFKVDTNFVFVSGYSSGALAAIHTAYWSEGDTQNITYNNVLERKGGLEGQSNNLLEVSSKVHGVINHAGGILDLNYIQADEPPIVSFHGSDDRSISINSANAVDPDFGNTGVLLHGSNSIHQRANELQIPNLLLVAPGGEHAIYSGDDEEQDFRRAFTDLKYLLCNNPSTSVSFNSLAEKEITLFPNPATTQLQIRFEGNEPLQLSLYNSIGKQVGSWEGIVTNTSIPLPYFSTGIYYYHITAPSNKGFQSGKLIINK